jgi:osmotically-inducible protein OsmY
MSHDSHLQQTVLAELGWDPSLDAGHIGVAVHDGVVTLSGHVESYPEKRAAEEAAYRVRGVKAVADEIVVRLPVETVRSDEEIAAAALERLAWDVTIPRDAITATVESGWVTLAGEVAWQYEKAAALKAVQTLHGVVGVTDHIRIKAEVDAANLCDDIVHALHRSWFFDPVTIEVTAEGGKVRLSGTVKSPHERQVAAATAWAAPGVTEVENDLTIA